MCQTNCLLHLLRNLRECPTKSAFCFLLITFLSFCPYLAFRVLFVFVYISGLVGPPPQSKECDVQPRGSPGISSVRSIKSKHLSTETCQKCQIIQSFQNFYVTSKTNENIYRPNQNNRQTAQKSTACNEVARHIPYSVLFNV